MLANLPLVAFVATTDLDRAHAFYGRVLGLRRIQTSDFANVYEAGGTQLRVTRVDSVLAASYTVLGWTVDDLHAAIGALTTRGVSFQRFDRLDQDPAGAWTSPGGARVAWFRDPDGNLLSLTQPAAPT